MHLSLDHLSLLPESVKRNILAHLPANSNEVVVSIASASNAAAPLSKAEQQGLSVQISSREVLLPSPKAGAAVVDGVLSQREVQVRVLEPFTSCVSAACIRLQHDPWSAQCLTRATMAFYAWLNLLALAPRLCLLRLKPGCQNMDADPAWAAAAQAGCGMTHYTGVTSTVGSPPQS
jgi:hypothetical protein